MPRYEPNIYEETEESLLAKVKLAETMMRTAWSRGLTRAQSHLEKLLGEYRGRLERVRAGKAAIDG